MVDRAKPASGSESDESVPDDRASLAVPSSFLSSQLSYYDARAPEYDEWFLRQGRYDRGEEFNRLWFAEIDEVNEALSIARSGGQVLELACGTGQWTRSLLPGARSLTVVDGSAEMLAEHRRRVDSPIIERIQANLFDWQPAQDYDFVFFGFWLSHVPHDRVDDFFTLVRRVLRPGGRFFLVDSRYHQASTARNHQLADRDLGIQERRLNDGRTYRIVKIFWPAPALAARLAGLGFEVGLRETANFFLYGDGTVDR